jgi:hypothetical protein
MSQFESTQKFWDEVCESLEMQLHIHLTLKATEAACLPMADRAFETRHTHKYNVQRTDRYVDSFLPRAEGSDLISPHK